MDLYRRPRLQRLPTAGMSDDPTYRHTDGTVTRIGDCLDGEVDCENYVKITDTQEF